MQDDPTGPDSSRPAVAPVALARRYDDAVSHSLAILSRVYHYNHWIFDSLRDYLGRTVLEVGAGVGNITQFLLNLDRVACLEPFEPYREHLLRRFAPHANVSVHPQRIEDCPDADLPEESFDSVICLNVLEHLEDDVEALTRMGRLAKPGGRVVVFAPALPVLYGALDRAMGHRRRYTRGSVRRAMVRAGLRPERCRYMNLLGAPAWWWAGRVVKTTEVSETATKAFDRLVPFLSAVERILPPLLGQSILAIARK